MAVRANYLVKNNNPIAKDVYMMRLSGPTESLVAPGQFVNIQLPGHYLRRPLSVSCWGEGWLEVVYKVVGDGTAQMAGFAPGERLDLLCGLGNGFTIEEALQATPRPVALIGGGVGTPPLLGLAQWLCKNGCTPLVALGFAAGADVFFKNEFEALGCRVLLATEDGGAGRKGYVTDLLRDEDYGYYFACGPGPMLRAVHRLGGDKGVAGQLSFEERMGCGHGACMGCSCHTRFGYKRICVEGPVLHSGEVVAE